LKYTQKVVAIKWTSIKSM